MSMVPFSSQLSTQDYGRMDQYKNSAGKKINKFLKRVNEQRKTRAAKKQKARSRTVTGFRENKSDQVSVAGGDSKSYFTRIQKPSSRLAKLAKDIASVAVVKNSAFRTSSLVGLQNYALIGTYYDKTDLANQFTANNINDFPSRRLVLKSEYHTAMITNQETANCYGTIFDCIATRDGNASTLDPVSVMLAGYTDSSGGTGSDPFIPGGSPYTNQRFLEYFKIKNTTPFVIGPGQTHAHTVHYAPNKVFSHELDTYILGGIRGLTMWSFIVFHGSPTNDITTKTQVSLSAISLDVVTKEEYKSSYVATNVGINFFTQGIPTAFTVAGNVMEDDGNIRPDTAA